MLDLASGSLRITMMQRYEFINHTADLGIKVSGETLSELFVNAAYAMFDILVDIAQVETAQALTVTIKGDTIEDIFFEWLRELLAKFNIHKLVFKQFKISTFDKSGLEAIVKGEKIDPGRHEFKTEIKAVTYHGLVVRKNNGLWEAQVIFDI